MVLSTADASFDRHLSLPAASLHERIEGIEISVEIQSPLAWFLWHGIRSANVWIDTAPGERASLFSQQTADTWQIELTTSVLPPALIPPLHSFGAIFSHPGQVSRSQLAIALQRLVIWADSEQHAHTAHLLADTAARLLPQHASFAYDAARHARIAGDPQNAEGWYQYGLSTARKTRDHQTVALCLLGLAGLSTRRGKLQKARRLSLCALRAARRSTSSHVKGMALHDLCVVSAEMNDLAQAELWAEKAVTTYGPAHPRLPALANDIAYIWMMRGDFAPALPVFEAVLGHGTELGETMRGWSHIARAAAGSGQRDRFESAWTQSTAAVLAADAAGPLAPAIADTLTELAHAALSMHETERALWAVETAEPIAKATRRHKTLFVLDALRDRARRHTANALEGTTAEKSDPEEHRMEISAHLVDSLEHSILAGTT